MQLSKNGTSERPTLHCWGFWLVLKQERLQNSTLESKHKLKLTMCVTDLSKTPDRLGRSMHDSKRGGLEARELDLS